MNLKLVHIYLCYTELYKCRKTWCHTSHTHDIVPLFFSRSLHRISWRLKWFSWTKQCSAPLFFSEKKKERLITWKYQSLHFAFHSKPIRINNNNELLKFNAIYLFQWRYCEFVLCFDWAHPAKANEQTNGPVSWNKACKPKQAEKSVHT